MIKNVKVAIVGAGYMAEEHIKAFVSIPNVSVVGIYSRTLKKSQILAERYKIPGVFDSIDTLFYQTNADLVVIAVSELATNAICKAAFKYPWQALIEKPVGYNYADSLDILHASKISQNKAFVALNRRHYSSTLSVIEGLKSNTESRFVQVFDQQNPMVAIEAGKPKIVVDNWMYANSIHLIDYLTIFCRGKVSSVERVLEWNPIDPWLVVAKIHFSSGDVGIYQAVWNAPGPWGVVVSTHSKRWELRPLESASTQLYKSRLSEPLSVSQADIDFKPGILRQAKEATKAVLGETHGLPTLEEGIKTMEIVRSIYEV